ncbi:MAG: hypothetical protein E7C39_01495 [Intestinibacter bartlettii]|nr:hypothetical protein [Intestinibacter bartlettii]MDU2692784.1 hypothetical protein [Intestinibacter bartlettii]
MKKKWVEIDEVVKIVHDLPNELKEYDKIMKQKPNFDKEKEDKKNKSKK